jgi:hypothetical protein
VHRAFNVISSKRLLRPEPIVSATAHTEVLGFVAATLAAGNDVVELEEGGRRAVMAGG